MYFSTHFSSPVVDMTVDVDEGVEHKQGGQVAVVEEGVAINENIHTIRAMKCGMLRKKEDYVQNQLHRIDDI